MSDSSSPSLGKWLAGILATIISALIIWLLTRPAGILNPNSPTPILLTSRPNEIMTTTKIELSQTQGQLLAAFGDSAAYVSYGHGQSFDVNKTATIKEIEIYLIDSLEGYGGSAQDQIICELRNARRTVLESSSIPGFSSGGGWQSFVFNSKVDPGIYIFTCYLKNHTHEKHDYIIGANTNDNSYLEGTRYVSVGGHPEDGSTWESSLPGDLNFKIKMEVLE